VLEELVGLSEVMYDFSASPERDLEVPWIGEMAGLVLCSVRTPATYHCPGCGHHVPADLLDRFLAERILLALEGGFLDRQLAAAGLDRSAAQAALCDEAEPGIERVVDALLEGIVFAHHDEDDEFDAERAVQIRWRLGQHERCPCGSGRTYKQCCGR
jgi:SEC-C motif